MPFGIKHNIIRTTYLVTRKLWTNEYYFYQFDLYLKLKINNTLFNKIYLFITFLENRTITLYSKLNKSISL